MPAPRQCAHAIVIIAVRGDGTLEILDPANPRAAQPVALSQEAFLLLWTGELVVATGS